MERIALVTGAGQGIGEGIAEALAADVDSLVLVDINEDLLEKRSAALRNAGRRVLHRRLDIADRDAVDDLLTWCRREAGTVNILVNNAAISGLRAGERVPLHELTLEEWDRCMAVNLTGVFLMCRAFAPGMIESGWGRIVNISSAAGRTYVPLAAGAYTAAKAGVGALTWALAGELGPHGITANCVAPGRIETPASRAVKRTAEYLDRIPRRRAGTPMDIAAAVRFFASEEADYVTGCTIDVNGGLFLGS